MKNEHIDPRRERLIAFLYGEMNEAQAREFSVELEKDGELRLELEELQGTRDILSGWKVTEPTPSFVFVAEDERRAPHAPAPWWRRVVDVVTGGGPAGFGLGLATAATAALVIALTGFRVERVDGGLAFRFGDAERPANVAPRSQERLSPGELPQNGTPLEYATSETPRTGSRDPNAYVTRAEVEDIATQMVGSVVDLLNQHGDRQNREFSGVLQTMYEDISDRQWRDSEELRQHMNTIGLELLMRQSRARAAGETTMAPTSLEPSESSTPPRPLEWKAEWR